MFNEIEFNNAMQNFFKCVHLDKADASPGEDRTVSSFRIPRLELSIREFIDSFMAIVECPTRHLFAEMSIW